VGTSAILDDSPDTISKISIQLVSPASGDYDPNFDRGNGFKDFHSISFPSEWGHLRVQESREILEVFPFN